MIEKPTYEILEKKIKILEQAEYERYHAERALKKSEDRFRAIFEGSRDAIFITDKNKRFAYVNQSACELTGYTKQELLKMCIPDLHSSEDLIAFNHYFDRTLCGRTSFSEANILHKDGFKVPTEFSNSAVTIDDKTYMHTIARDMTNRKKAEEALRESENRYRLLSDATFEAIFISEQGVCVGQNNTASKMFGYSDQEAIGRMGTDWIHPDDHGLVRKNILSGFEDPYEARALRKDGSIFFCSIQGRTFSHNDKDLRITALRDINAQKQAEKERDELHSQLIQTQKMESIGTLAGGIAHDFNNILFPIIGHTEMLMEDIPTAGPIRNSLQQIYTSALRARDLVQQILAFARQEKNELKLMRMQPIVKEALKLIRSTIPTTISITQNIQSDCGAVKADPTQIHQIVMNLAANAFHAMEENGGELKVNLEEIKLGEDDLINSDMSPGLYACLTVADTGIGIDADNFSRIFDPFFTTKQKGKGTGMGLSVVHGIVKSISGVIKVYSEPGEGTEFRVHLPIADGPTANNDILVDGPIMRGNERILLVDDETDIIEIEKQSLERLGYSVKSRTSSIEALEAFRANAGNFDLVITDMSMPKMPGDKLAVELIKIRPDIPILLCTGFSESMTDEKIKSLGIKGLLMKPMVIKDLAKKLRDILDEGRYA